MIYTYSGTSPTATTGFCREWCKALTMGEKEMCEYICPNATGEELYAGVFLSLVDFSISLAIQEKHSVWKRRQLTEHFSKLFFVVCSLWRFHVPSNEKQKIVTTFLQWYLTIWTTLSMILKTSRNNPSPIFDDMSLYAFQKALIRGTDPAFQSVKQAWFNLTNNTCDKSETSSFIAYTWCLEHTSAISVQKCKTLIEILFSPIANCLLCNV